MRRKEFIAKHRGGTLSKKNHILLILWAAECAEHVLQIFQSISSDTRPLNAIKIAQEWADGKVTVGEARNAAVAAHEAARNIKNKSQAACHAARAAGHAVATAHMADHCLQAANYALKAVSAHTQISAEEISWQNKQLPDDIQEIVLKSRKL